MTFIPDTAWALQERDSKGADSNTKEGHRLVHVAEVAGTLDASFARLQGQDDQHALRAGAPMFIALQDAGRRSVLSDAQTVLGLVDATLAVAHTLKAEGDASANCPSCGHPWWAHDEGGFCAKCAGAEACGNARTVASVAVRGRADGQEWEMGEPEIGNALRAGDGGSSRGNWLLAQMAVRRLTPTECERLMGFEDGWTDGQADSTRYRQLGNAVAVPVIEWIGARLRLVEEGR